MSEHYMYVVFIFEKNWRYIVKNIKFIYCFYNNPQPTQIYFVKSSKFSFLLSHNVVLSVLTYAVPVNFFVCKFQPGIRDI
jgi:hypothetical protein